MFNKCLLAIHWGPNPSLCSGNTKRNKTRAPILKVCKIWEGRETSKYINYTPEQEFISLQINVPPRSSWQSASTRKTSHPRDDGLHSLAYTFLAKRLLPFIICPPAYKNSFQIKLMILWSRDLNITHIEKSSHNDQNAVDSLAYQNGSMFTFYTLTHKILTFRLKCLIA